MSVTVHNIFPTPVGQFSLNREMTAEEMAFAEAQTAHRNIGNSTSNNRYVLKDPALADISKFIEESVAAYFKAIYVPKNEVSLKVTQSWLNYSKPEEWHHRHAHANSFVSGVFYIKAANAEDRIYFHKDGYAQIQVTTKEYNLCNSTSWWFSVNTGMLLLFPSGLTHSVDPVKGDNVRVSLAFNTFPVGYVGEEDNLTALHL